jgi:Lambda phage tail tube protein, TTP
MSLGIAAYSTVLSRGDGGGTEVFTAIAEVTKIETPALKGDAPDVTAHSDAFPFTVTGSSTTMTVAASALLPVGTVIRLTTTGTLPVGTALATDYYIVSRAASPGTSATISATLGGAAIVFGDTGTGTHTLMEGRGWKEFVGTLRDPGQMTLDMSFMPANATQSGTAGLILDLKNGTRRNFTLTFPDTTVMGPFTALVADFKLSAPVDGKLSAVCTLRLSGNPTAP